MTHDVWVIYPSREDHGRYIAHSLRTDQIGVGECIVDAIVELTIALRTLAKETKRDPHLNPYRDAPTEVWDMLNRAKKLPAEVLEVAAMHLKGRNTPTRSRKWQDVRWRIPRTISPNPELIHA